ncbi:MAG: signal recognition particle-docking protein FtsY [Chromatiales bacterium]|nr:signal recognition particle-docking protein FtsY [Chromatiales bacterium]
MFGFGKKTPVSDPADSASVPEDAPRGWFARLRTGLGKTRARLGDGLAALFAGRRELDAALLDEIETVLLGADVGVEASERIIGTLKARVARQRPGEPEQLWNALREAMIELLEPVSAPLEIDPARRPYVILTVGVNGAGKTTTIGKLAARFRHAGHSVLLAAGDTFRAAAIDQLQRWGERVGAAVVAQAHGADSAAVIYDALERARARDVDVLIADTAGRLHTQSNLIDELKKVRRVLTKLDPEAPHEVLLVIDAGTGQNAIAQAEQFRAAVGVTGLALTKLDGTARGGVAFAIAGRLGLPIRLIGVGEGEDDLRDFDAAAFVDALLGR